MELVKPIIWSPEADLDLEHTVVYLESKMVYCSSARFYH